MSASFCPGCGHRLYQHNAEGCEHVTPVYPELIDILDAHAPTSTYACLCGTVCPTREIWSQHVVTAAKTATGAIECGCERGHPLL